MVEAQISIHLNKETSASTPPNRAGGVGKSEISGESCRSGSVLRFDPSLQLGPWGWRPEWVAIEGNKICFCLQQTGSFQDPIGTESKVVEDRGPFVYY